MPNPFEVLGVLPVGGGACVALDASALASVDLAAFEVAGELGTSRGAGVEAASLRVRASEVVVAVRRRAGGAVDQVLIAAAPGSAVPVAPLVETGLMGATPDPDVPAVDLALPSGRLAVVAPCAQHRAHAAAQLVAVRPGAWRVELARLALPRGEQVLGWICSLHGEG
jgi:hypothetical protein